MKLLKIGATIILPIIIYLDWFINKSILKNIGLTIFIIGFLILFGLYGIWKEKILAIVLVSTGLLLIGFNQGEMNLETIFFAFLFLLFIEFSHASIRIKDRNLKPYLSIMPIYMILVFILSILVLKTPLIIGLFEPRLNESIELNSVYGIVFSMTIVFGFALIVSVLMERIRKQ